jgi:hypothetical protein
VKIPAIIFPSLFIPPIFARLEAMLKKTSGTMIINNKFKNKSPNGFTTAVFGPKTTPAIPPIRMERSRKMVSL